MKTAILQVADTGPLESLVEMLQSVGYACLLPSRDLKDVLKSHYCDNVSDIDTLVKNEGYEYPRFKLGEASPLDMDSCDLYVDVKAHRNGPRIWKTLPRLRDRTLWYRINGGKPEHVVNERGDMGDEVNPPCPVLTPNQWYGDCLACHSRNKILFFRNPGPCKFCGGDYGSVGKTTNPYFYACWPPFVGAEDYSGPRPRGTQEATGRKSRDSRYTPPICLVHNFQGWGYAPLLDVAREFGVRIHGVRSPDGLLQHREVKVHLSQCLAYVHLKSSDAPGYALYEALASACPVVCSRRLIWKNRMEDLLIPGETCLVFDVANHDPLSPEVVAECRREIGAGLKALSDHQENARVGENGRRKLRELMWSKDKAEDIGSLRKFFSANFPA